MCHVSHSYLTCNVSVLWKWSESHSVVSDSATPWTVCPWNFPVQNTGVGSWSLFQGIFPTQGLNPGLPHCRQILYHLSHQGSPVVKYWNFVTVFVTSFCYPGPASPGNHRSVSVTLGWFAFSRILCKWSHTFYILLALFLSLSKIILKFLQVHRVVHSFLLLSSTPLHGYNTGDRHLGCLQYLAMMNKAALHIHICNALYGYLIYFK